LILKPLSAGRRRSQWAELPRSFSRLSLTSEKPIAEGLRETL
jgi:hypothetical protein